MLAKAVREVEHAVERGQISNGHYTKYQVVALLARDERARVKADAELTDAQRDGQLKRLEGIATILAQTAAREPSFFHLLAEDAEVSDSARRLKREMQIAGGLAPSADTEPPEPQAASVLRADKQVVPPSVLQAQLSNPFQVPDFSGVPERPEHRRLVGWELIEPLLNSFEQAEPAAAACMDLPDPRNVQTRAGRELMHHQARMIAAAAEITDRVRAERERWAKLLETISDSLLNEVSVVQTIGPMANTTSSDAGSNRTRSGSYTSHRSGR